MSLPGSALRTFAVDATGAETETTRVDHRPPPVLGADADTVRDWLAGPVPVRGVPVTSDSAAHSTTSGDAV
ncbi:hypothetical protein GCM10020295_77900 [Streptomyces cinereospinus]